MHQTVNASEHKAKYENVTKDIFDLRDYYSGASKELKNVTGYRYSKGGKHYLIFDKNRKFTRVQIFGKDIERFKARKNPGLDIYCLLKKRKTVMAQCFHMVVSLRKIKTLIMII
ncbi:hypothetical protein ACVNPX_08245 [Staphylococcus aureus]